MKSILILLGVCAIIFFAFYLHKGDAVDTNNIPVIGIVTIPEYSQMTANNLLYSNTTFIHAQYVKYVESVGAVAIPIQYNESPDRIEYLMNHINGVLFTGGALDFADDKPKEWFPYTQTLNLIFEKAKRLNDKGVNFPIWGTCMGHQFLMFLVSKDLNLLKSTDSYYTQDSLTFSFTNKTDTKLFANFSDDLLQAAQNMNITTNFHHWGLYTKDFLSTQQPYSKFYKLLSTSTDKKRRVVC